MPPLVHPALREGLSQKEVKNLLYLSLAAGVVSSVAGYWAFNEAKGEERVPLGKAAVKAAMVGIASLAATLVLETYLINKAETKT